VLEHYWIEDLAPGVGGGKICGKKLTKNVFFIFRISAEGESVPASSDNSTQTGEKPAACSGGGDTPARLCKSSFNTTAPMYGVSLTSGKPVTIVQGPTS